MTGLQSRSRVQREISRTTKRQDGLLRFGTKSYRRAMPVDRADDADERDDLVNDAG